MSFVTHGPFADTDTHDRLAYVFVVSDTFTDDILSMVSKRKAEISEKLRIDSMQILTLEAIQ